MCTGHKKYLPALTTSFPTSELTTENAALIIANNIKQTINKSIARNAVVVIIIL